MPLFHVAMPEEQQQQICSLACLGLLTQLPSALVMKTVVIAASLLHNCSLKASSYVIRKLWWRVYALNFLICAHVCMTWNVNVIRLSSVSR
jgi:hypothetical protein